MTIGGKEYREILILSGDSELLAWITDERVVEHDGIHAITVDADSKAETLFQDNDNTIKVLFCEGRSPE